jgi:hypothetical protein
MAGMNTIDPAVLADLMIKADFKPGSQPSPDLLRLATLLVERCVVIAGLHESCEPREIGADIRAQFGLG